MKKVKIVKSGLVIVDEKNVVIAEASWAAVSLAFMDSESHYSNNGSFTLAEDARVFWESLKETSNYKKWADSL